MSTALFYLFLAVAFSLAIGNVLVTRNIWRDHRRAQAEKLAETGLVWVVPVFGALLSIAISLDGPEAVRDADPIETAGGAAGAVSSFLS